MTNLNDRESALLDMIKEQFRERRTYEQWMGAADEEGINSLRSLGRRAGRELGWKVRTFVIEPAEPDGSVLVVLAVTESNPLHEQLMTMRAHKALREAWNRGEL